MNVYLLEHSKESMEKLLLDHIVHMSYGKYDALRNKAIVIPSAMPTQERRKRYNRERQIFSRQCSRRHESVPRSTCYIISSFHGFER